MCLIWVPEVWLCLSLSTYQCTPLRKTMVPINRWVASHIHLIRDLIWYLYTLLAMCCWYMELVCASWSVSMPTYVQHLSLCLQYACTLLFHYLSLYRSLSLSLIQTQKFDPDHVGNSIRALALSVQDTSLFGELPRPRMKSSAYAKKWWTHTPRTFLGNMYYLFTMAYTGYSLTVTYLLYCTVHSTTPACYYIVICVSLALTVIVLGVCFLFLWFAVLRVLPKLALACKFHHSV